MKHYDEFGDVCKVLYPVLYVLGAVILWIIGRVLVSSFMLGH